MSDLPVDGLDDWEAWLDVLPSRAADEIKSAISKNVSEFEKGLHSVVPEKTGDLATTITSKIEANGMSGSVTIGDEKSPAPPVEFGHMDHGKHVPASPFFFPLRRVSQKRALSRLRRAIKKAAGIYDEAGDDE